MRKTYPSDIGREQFERILPILESAKKKTKPRTVDLYDIFLWYCICFKKWVSVANVTKRFSEMGTLLFLF